MCCDDDMTQHAPCLLFQAISPRSTFKNGNNLLIVLLKMPQYLILIVNHAYVLEEDLLEPGLGVWFCAKNSTRQSFPKFSSDLNFP